MEPQAKHEWVECIITLYDLKQTTDERHESTKQRTGEGKRNTVQVITLSGVVQDVNELIQDNSRKVKEICK